MSNKFETDSKCTYKLNRIEEVVNLHLSGDFSFGSISPVWKQIHKEIFSVLPKHLNVDCKNISYCDNSGIALLFKLKIIGKQRNFPVRIEGLNDNFQRLLDFYDESKFAVEKIEKRKHTNAAEEVGRATIHIWNDLIRDQISYLGRLSSAIIKAIFIPWNIRWNDLFLVAERTGANAVGIVMLLGFLFGLIMAYSAAMPMRQFGVDVYVSDLAAMAIIRIFGPFITAVIVAGRSGSAYAAEIGTMKINNEIDALVTMGIDPIPFLVVPRVLATTFVTPLLAILADILGLIGTGLVMLSLGFPLVTYTTHVMDSINSTDILGGLFKAFVYGGLISSVGCLRGLQTESGSSAVGISTTRAVVSGIVLIVVAEGIFAVLFHYLGI